MLEVLRSALIGDLIQGTADDDGRAAKRKLVSQLRESLLTPATTFRAAVIAAAGRVQEKTFSRRSVNNRP